MTQPKYIRLKSVTQPKYPILATPTVHLNGTSQKELLEQIHNVLYALEDAYTAMCKAAPHGRDYYIQRDYDGKTAYEVARENHIDRLTRLDKIKEEYTIIAEEIYQQERDRT